MADDTAVNSQVTDSVTQSNVMTLGVGAANSAANLYQQMAQANGLGMQNAVSTQQRQNTLDSAIVTQSVNSIFSLPTATTTRATVRELGTVAGGDRIIILAALKALNDLVATRRSGDVTRSKRQTYDGTTVAPQAAAPEPEPASAPAEEKPAGPFPQGSPRP